MDDLISRQAAIDALAKELKGVFVEYRDIAEKLIGKLPSAQPQRMKGRWIDVTKTGGAELWKCSECGELELEDSYFCPNCGADMRTKETDCDYERAVEQLEHDILYEPTFNQDDGSM